MKMTNLTTHFFMLILFLVGSLQFVQAAPQSGENSSIYNNNPSTRSLFESLQREDVLNITIEGNFTEIIDGEGKSKYQAAKMTYEAENGEAVNWNIEVRQRGKSRRRFCDFPPLKLRFNKADLAANGLRDFHTLKLVTHCLDQAALAKEAVLREYLAYQVFNEITDHSFRVQLVRINYVDNSGQFSKLKRYGFIIENNKEMAERIDGKICDCMNVDVAQRNAKFEAQTALFQYMIGNQDWDMKFARNIKYVQSKEDGSFVIVPYDFDFSGFVSTPYAKPSPDFGLSSIKDRIYLGDTTDEAAIRAALTTFNDKKEAIYQRVNEFKKLDRFVRSEIIYYLESFFQAADYDSIFGQQELEASSERLPAEISKDD